MHLECRIIRNLICVGFINYMGKFFLHELRISITLKVFTKKIYFEWVFYMKKEFDMDLSSRGYGFGREMRVVRGK